MGPDRAGLKDVAAAAGVSHALVTHYFGTFSNLVETVLEVQMAELTETIIGKLAENDADMELGELVDLIFSEFRKPAYGRLAAWAHLSGRLESAAFFAHRKKGFRRIADVVVARTTEYGSHLGRDEIEHLLILVFCTIASYAVVAPTLWQALGEKQTEERDQRFTEFVVSVIRQRLESA